MPYGTKQVYSNTAVITTINGAFNSGATSLTLTAGTGWPAPGTNEVALAAVDWGQGNVEVISYTSLVGLTVSGIARGLDGTSESSHSSGAAIRHIASADDIETIWSHLWSGKHYAEPLVTLNPAGATPTLDMLQSNNFELVLSANVTSLTISNPPPASAGLIALFIVVRNTGTAYTFTWPSSFKWANNTTPVLSGINKADFVTAISLNGGSTYGASLTQNYSGL